MNSNTIRKVPKISSKTLTWFIENYLLLRIYDLMRGWKKQVYLRAITMSVDKVIKNFQVLMRVGTIHRSALERESW